MKENNLVIGLMSGTSLDGLDIVACRFDIADCSKFTVEASDTIQYTKEWRRRLENMPLMCSSDLIQSDRMYGKYLGELVSDFIRKYNLKPSCIASHGHTVFHMPENGYTFQAGHGAYIAKAAGIEVICDFRSSDVAAGGQGAPLVPIGDALLFGNYDAALNLGGFSNISYTINARRIAFDICPVNFVFNHYARALGCDFDNNGEIASSGSIIESLLAELNALEYYTLSSPKSLGMEWIQSYFNPILAAYDQARVPDILRTLSEHAAIQIASAIPADCSLLITGGGALNRFLMNRIQFYAKSKIVLPELELVHYKEAIIFAFLGFLRKYEMINIWCSATGAQVDSIGGAHYLP